MSFFYPLIIAFSLVFISELGDKTQLLVLSFSSKTKTIFILLGVALGSFFSHGIAILFGSSLAFFGNESFHFLLELCTYFTFFIFGIFSFLPKKEKSSTHPFLEKLNHSKGYIFLIASSIAIGEFGDKTFLASIGLGISYPSYKISLILGAILGMVLSDSFAILFGKFLKNKISEQKMQFLSGILFLIFGALGLLHLAIFP